MTYAAINPKSGKDYKAIILFMLLSWSGGSTQLLNVFVLGGDRRLPLMAVSGRFDFAMYVCC